MWPSGGFEYEIDSLGLDTPKDARDRGTDGFAGCVGGGDWGLDGDGPGSVLKSKDSFLVIHLE